MRAGACTVQLHEGIKGPILGIIALFMLTKHPGLEGSSVPELGVIPDLRSPLRRRGKSGSAQNTRKDHGT